MAKKWNWKIDSDSGRMVSNSNSWFTRFVGWINAMFNDQHAWFDYDSLDNSLSSVQNQITQEGLTGAQREANAFSSEEAQKQRDWETEMSNTAFQRQVSDMQAAGVNPALAMSGSMGASTPSGSSASSVSPNNGLSMSDLIQLMTLPKQMKLLDTQMRNIDSQTDKNAAETENMRLVNQYYPDVTLTGIKKTLSEIGFNDAQIDEAFSRIDLQDLEKELKKSDIVIKEAEANTASDYYHWRVEYEKAQTEEAKNTAGLRAVEAAMNELERNYMAHTNNRMGSNSMVALASAIGTLLSNFNLDIDTPEVKKILGDKWQQLKDWINKPKDLRFRYKSDYAPGGKYGPSE